jgi:uncharacterized protein (DUF1697 family)
MNVGAHHRASNEELRTVFSEMGFEDVRTFRASGNVSFSAESEPLAQMTERIENALQKSLGFAVPTFVRDATEMLEIAAVAPFDPDIVEASQGKLQVSLLATAPPSAVRAQILALGGEEDRLVFGERELYWLPSGGLLESSLDLATIDRALGPSTRRTKGTIDLMTAKHFGG